MLGATSHQLGSTAIGIRTAEGVILAAEKRLTSKLVEPWSIEKVLEIDSHIGCAMSGLMADGRSLVDTARVETQHHRFTFNEPMSVLATTQAISDQALAFGDAENDDKPMSRPFGVALLVAGVDDSGPMLFHTDPSGTFVRYDAKAIGAAEEGAQTHLEEQYDKSMSLKEGLLCALRILKQVMEEQIDSLNVEVAVVPTVSRQYRLLSQAEIQALIGELAPALTA